MSCHCSDIKNEASLVQQGVKKIAHLPSCFENFTPYVTNTFSGVTQLSHSVFNGGGGNLLKVTYN